MFLGAAAGVGKTYAMLEQARLRRRARRRRRRRLGGDPRPPETEALLDGLEILPPSASEYRGPILREFDLDAALARKPALLLLDELAHTNAPGARHAKRWQDAEELLDAGIDVYTTVNVQHLESLNDIVAQTTGVVVRETVPDRLLDEADEIELVDITPDDLLERLKEGKVYVPAQAERAMRGFFSRGNLIALRELALRRAAERVDAQMRTYKDDRRSVPSGPSPSASSSASARAPARRGSSVRAAPDGGRAARGWIVASRGDAPGIPGSRRRTGTRISQTFRLAEQLGRRDRHPGGTRRRAKSCSPMPATQNVTKIVVGKPARPWWRYRLFGSVVDELIRGSDEIDVYVIRGEKDEEPLRARSAPAPSRSPVRSYLWGVCAVGAATGICRPHVPPLRAAEPDHGLPPRGRLRGGGVGSRSVACSPRSSAWRRSTSSSCRRI